MPKGPIPLRRSLANARMGETGSELPISLAGIQSSANPESLGSLDEAALKQLANTAHDQFFTLIRTALARCARLAGAALNEIKDRLPHGKWESWLLNNFRGSARTARVYMSIARGWSVLDEQGFTRREEVTLEELRRALTARKRNEPKREEIVDAHAADEFDPPPAPPRVLSLYVCAEAYPEVESRIERLSKRFNQTNATDTILAVIRWCDEMEIACV